MSVPINDQNDDGCASLAGFYTRGWTTSPCTAWSTRSPSHASVRLKMGTRQAVRSVWWPMAQCWDAGKRRLDTGTARTVILIVQRCKMTSSSTIWLCVAQTRLETPWAAPSAVPLVRGSFHFDRVMVAEKRLRALLLKFASSCKDKKRGLSASEFQDLCNGINRSVVEVRPYLVSRAADPAFW